VVGDARTKMTVLHAGDVAPDPHATIQPPRLPEMSAPLAPPEVAVRSIHPDGMDSCHVVVIVPYFQPLDCMGRTLRPMEPLDAKTDGSAYSPFVALTALAV
jgi:hypothetical protein